MRAREAIGQTNPLTGQPFCTRQGNLPKSDILALPRAVCRQVRPQIEAALATKAQRVPLSSIAARMKHDSLGNRLRRVARTAKTVLGSSGFIKPCTPMETQ